MQNVRRRRQGMAVLVGATATSVILAVVQSMYRHGYGVTTMGSGLRRNGPAWGRSAVRRISPAASIEPAAVSEAA
jgi:hypothetical protein